MGRCPPAQGAERARCRLRLSSKVALVGPLVGHRGRGSEVLLAFLGGFLCLSIWSYPRCTEDAWVLARRVPGVSLSGGDTWGGREPQMSSRQPCRCAQMLSSPEGPWVMQRHETLGTCVPQRAGSVDGSEHGSGAGLRGRHQAGVLRVGAQREAGPALGSSPCSLPALCSGPLPGPAGTAQSAPFLRAKSLAASSVQGHFSRTHSRAVLLSQCPAWT